MAKKNLIDLNQIGDGCYIVELIYDDRMFPIDGIIKKSNDVLAKENQINGTLAGRKLTEVIGRTPSLTYSLKLIDYVIRSGKAKSFIDYWKKSGLEVTIDCFKIGDKECLGIVRETKKMTEKEFLLNQQNERMKMDLIHKNNFFISSFAFNVDDEEVTFLNFPKDVNPINFKGIDIRDYFIKELLHPDDKSYFETRYKLQEIMAETSNTGEWVTEIRRKCGKEYRYVKCVIKKSTVKDDLFFGWEYDTTSEHIINDAEQKRENYFGLYARALESVGKKFYGIYGVDLNDNSIVVINQNEDFTPLLVETKVDGKKGIKLQKEYIHPEDCEKVANFFNLKRLDRTFIHGNEKKSLKFRRIIDWTYQWVKVTATKLYNLGQDIILFSFENINEEVQKEYNHSELISFFKEEYSLSIYVDLDEMTYVAEWQDEKIHSLPTKGYYDTLYNLIVTDNSDTVIKSFDDLFKPENIIKNYNTDRKMYKIKMNFKTKTEVKLHNLKLFYRFVNEKRVAYILVKEVRA